MELSGGRDESLSAGRAGTNIVAPETYVSLG